MPERFTSNQEEILKEESINKEIKAAFEQDFEITEDGIYLIEIIASAKSWWQNLKKLRAFFNDDDLTVKIDDIEFPKLNSKKGLFDGEVAWNGNNLRGLRKTDVFIIQLTKGLHQIHFIVNKKPFLKSIKISKVENENCIKYVPSEENKQAQDGNNRQWINFVFTDLPVKNIKISAKTEKRKKDMDDIKLIIDGVIQENQNPDSEYFKNWYWCGSLDDGKEKTFKKELNLSKGLHYIELWADRMPTLNKVKMDVGDKDKPVDQLTAKVIWESTVLRRHPKQDEGNIEQDLEEGEEVFVVEKAVKGERPRNSNNKLLSSNRWHKVKYKDQEGYIYSEALEVNGESKEIIQKIIIKESKKLKLDPEILLALADCEAQFFPYTVSYDEKAPEIAFGVMQISKKLYIDLNDKRKAFYSPIDNIFDIEQNIRAGVKYFKQLYQDKYGSDKDRLRKAVSAYNTGPGHVTVNEPLRLELYAGQTQRLVNCVEAHLKKGTFKKLLQATKKLLILSIFLIVLWVSYEKIVIARVHSIHIEKILKKELKETNLSQQYANYRIIQEEYVDLNFDDNKKLPIRLAVINNNIDSVLSIGISKIILVRDNGYFLELPGWGEGFNWWEVGDSNNNTLLDVSILYKNGGNGAYNKFYFYEWNGRNFEIKLHNNNLHNWDKLKDLDGDGVMEIIHSFHLLRWAYDWTDIYKWNTIKQDWQKSNQLFPEFYEKWLIDKEIIPGITYENPPDEYFDTAEWRDTIQIDKCLQGKAYLNSQGIFADVEDCFYEI